MLLADTLTIDATYAIGIVISMVSTLVIAIRFMFVMLITSKDKELASKQVEFDLLMKEKATEFAAMISIKEALIVELSTINKSYRELAKESIDSAHQMAQAMQQRCGEPGPDVLLPVIPESHSPPTSAQQTSAEIATLRATLAAVKKTMGQSPRELPPEHQDAAQY